MRVTAAGEVYLLERHLERVSRSAKYFSFQCDLERIRAEIPSGAAMRLRLLLSTDGSFDWEASPIPDSNPKFLKLASVQVNSQDPFLRHKTTRRQIYDEARAGCSADTDVILLNERGEITETTIANIAVFREGRWITPAAACGLLPGVLRAELLVAQQIAEGVVHATQLHPGETIRCFNSLRGVYESAFTSRRLR